MILRTWLNQAQLAAAEALEVTRRVVTPGQLSGKQIDATMLESRVLLSASPMAAALVDNVEAPADSTDVASFEQAVEDGQADPSHNVAVVDASNLPSEKRPWVRTLELPSIDPADSELQEQGLSHELVFVDTAAEGYEQLLNDLLSNADESRNFEVVLLDSTTDGIEQISDVLVRYDNLDAVHVVSHGTDGAVRLGNIWLDSENVSAYAGQITGWQDAFSSEADLLFYGCDLAAGVDGRTLLAAIGALCDCDVAASVDDTGNATLGGDWDLEYVTGSIETSVAFNSDLQDNWPSLLAVINVNQTADVGAYEYEPPNASPVLADTVVALSSIAEDAGAPSGAVGTLISAMADLKPPAGGQDNVTDADSSSSTGAAIIGADTTNGTWWYTTDGGTIWNSLGAVSAGSARVLAADANTRIYFQPNVNYEGTIASAITFRAWDQTDGTNGSTADLTGVSTLLDQFSAVSYSNNDGTASWTSDWVELNDDGFAATSNIRIESNKLHVDNLDGGSFSSVTRAADLATATTATLTMDYDGVREGTVGGDRFTVEVSNDGGAIWTLLEEITAPRRNYR